jgi:hypothetical protein
LIHQARAQLGGDFQGQLHHAVGHDHQLNGFTRHLAIFARTEEQFGWTIWSG